MKGKIICMTLFLFTIFTFASFAEDTLKLSPDIKVSLDLQDAKLKDILKAFSMQAGLNFIASEAVQERTVTLYLDKVSVKDALDQFFKANNLTYTYDSKSNIIYVTEWGRPGVETITRVFNLSYARVSNSPLSQQIAKSMGTTSDTSGGISAAVKNILSPNGKVIEDSRTNSLIVTDVPSSFPAIEQLVLAMDVSTPQVLIEVEMLDVSKSTVDAMGASFGGASGHLFTLASGTTLSTTFPFGSFASIFEGKRAGLGTLSAPDFLTAIDFLTTDTTTKYLARPRILTLSNEPAEVRISAQEVVGLTVNNSNPGVGTNSTTQVTVTAERMETGIILKVTPQVNVLTNEITMFIEPSVIEAKQSTFKEPITGSFYKDPETRGTKSTVKIKDGDTIVLGGLLRNRLNKSVQKIPVLGDIPIFGLIFQHHATNPSEERELIAFITPRIVKPGIKKPVEKKPALKPVILGIDREQDFSRAQKDAAADILDLYEKKTAKAKK